MVCWYCAIRSWSGHITSPVIGKTCVICCANSTGTNASDEVLALSTSAAWDHKDRDKQADNTIPVNTKRTEVFIETKSHLVIKTTFLPRGQELNAKIVIFWKIAIAKNMLCNISFYWNSPQHTKVQAQQMSTTTRTRSWYSSEEENFTSHIECFFIIKFRAQRNMFFFDIFKQSLLLSLIFR